VAELEPDVHAGAPMTRPPDFKILAVGQSETQQAAMVDDPAELAK
jgi:hypothetical protein